jgi:hypothetical protein
MGVLFVYVFQNKINLKRFKYFLILFLLLFIFSPSIYYYYSINNKDRRINYPGKEIGLFVQTEWDKNFSNKIEIVFGNEWDAGNLSYNLKSRPKWTKEAPNNTNVGIIVIGDYDNNIYVNKICETPIISSHVVLLQHESFNHNICMIGKK